MRRSERRGFLWTFTEKDRHSPWQRSYRFDFSYIRSDRLRRELQDYVWSHYRSKGKTLATLRQEYSWMKYYEAWLYERGIESLSQIRQADVDGFLAYLHTCVSGKTNRPLRLITQKHIYDTVRGIYRWHAVRQPEYACTLQLFPTDVYQRINRVTRTECVSQGDVVKVLQTLERAKEPCLRCGGTILAVTGLSPSDLLSLRTDCIQMRKKGASLRYYHHRKHKFCTIPVSTACVQAVQMLTEQTRQLRQIAPEDRQQQLFLYCDKWGQVITPDPDLFRYWMRRAQMTGQLQSEADAQIYDAGADMSHTRQAAYLSNVPDTPDAKLLTCTMVRYALLHDMWERKVPYMVIRELTGYPLFSERGCIA